MQEVSKSSRFCQESSIWFGLVLGQKPTELKHFSRPYGENQFDLLQKPNGRNKNYLRFLQQSKEI